MNNTSYLIPTPNKPGTFTEFTEHEYIEHCTIYMDDKAKRMFTLQFEQGKIECELENNAWLSQEQTSRYIDRLNEISKKLGE